MDGKFERWTGKRETNFQNSPAINGAVVSKYTHLRFDNWKIYIFVFSCFKFNLFLNYFQKSRTGPNI